MAQALCPEIAQATSEEKRDRSDHDPTFTAAWDLAGLREPFREMLPTPIDRNVAAFCDPHATCFRHQSPDYRPGEGFVAVRAGEELQQMVSETPQAG